YKDSNKKAEMSKRFSNIQDYIFEYCNFCCPYFVLRHLSKQEVKKLIEEVHPSDVIDDDNKLQDVKIKPTIQDTEH
ncbi:YutD-like domain-containing protein, partial [Staphylococcus aureus]